MTKNATLNHRPATSSLAVNAPSLLNQWKGRETFNPVAGQTVFVWGSALVLLAMTILNLLTPRNELDQNLLEFAVAHRSVFVSDLMLALTDVFSPSHIVIFAVIAALGFALKRHSLKLGVAVLGSVGIASVVDQLLKHLVGRTRPDLSYQIVHETDLSFPSGHATGIVALCLAIYLATRSVINLRSRRMSRRLSLLGWTLFVLAALVSVSRVYVAAHWGTDIVAAVGLGLLVTYLWFWATEKIFARFA